MSEPTTAPEARIPPAAPAPSPAPGARGLFARLVREPNPVWARELRQVARRGQTPVFLLLVTTLLSLLMAAIGSALATARAPAQIGTTLFQVFFSLAYFLVVLLAGALAASSIGAERDARTWEPLELTGLEPAEIAHGKLGASLTTVGLYIVALAPIGALCFLFGGVTVGELALAFVALGALAVLSASFGLAVGSRIERLGSAVIATLLVVAPAAVIGWSTLGFGLAFRAHDVWPAVPRAPVWLPAAWTRAPLDLAYLEWLVLVPLLALVVPTWFFREAAIAGLTSLTDDRSTGLKRWFVVTTPLVAAALLLPGAATTGVARRAALGAALACVLLLLAFATLVFAGEPLEASRRVRARWAREGTPALARVLGPGLARTSLLVLLLGVVVVGATTAAACALLVHDAAPDWTGVGQLLALAVYGAAFFLFLVGLATAARAGAPTGNSARTAVGAALFVASILPWLVALFAGVLLHSDPREMLLVAPSPFFVPARVLPAIETGDHAPVVAGAVAAALWAILGAALLAAGLARAARVVREHERALAESDARLAAEEAAKRA